LRPLAASALVLRLALLQVIIVAAWARLLAALRLDFLVMPGLSPFLPAPQTRLRARFGLTLSSGLPLRSLHPGGRLGTWLHARSRLRLRSGLRLHARTRLRLRLHARPRLRLHARTRLRLRLHARTRLRLRLHARTRLRLRSRLHARPRPGLGSTLRSLTALYSLRSAGIALGRRVHDHNARARLLG